MINSQEHSTPVLALHGFTLGGVMFAELAELLDADVIAPDLPGHGGRDATNTDWDGAVAEIVGLVGETRPSVVLGYSMGGRLALAAALREPDLFNRLVLVSTSLGIASEADRVARLRRDEASAAAIEASGNAEGFLRAFGATPFLQAPGATIDLESIRLDNSPEGIAGALRGMGQGSQPYFGDEIAGLHVPIVWMAGAGDEKYKTIAAEAAAACPQGRVVIADAAHNVIAQDPAAVARVVGGA